MRRIATLALPLLALALTGAAPVDDIAVAERLRDRALAGSQAYAIVESLTTEIGPRLAASEAEARARDWGAAKLKALGFQNVRIETFDMPGWERGVETAAIVAPFPQKLHVTALGRSGATPASGIEAEIVRFTSLDDLHAAPEGSLKGKIVFMTHRMMRTQDGSSYGAHGLIRRAAPSIAARKGAAAVLIRSLGTDYHRNPHTGSTNWDAGVAPIAAGALSLPDAEQIERILDRGKPVRLQLVMTPRFVGTRQSGNVIGEIVGSDAPDEIVLISGHLDSWDLGTGAIDDGAGIAITTAAAKLIMDQGLKPRRTIRVVMWGAEELGQPGARSYAVTHAGEKTVVAAESDLGADRIWKLGSRVADSAKPALAAMMRVLAPLGVTLDPANDNRGGADIAHLAAQGVPTLAPEQDGTDYFDVHHTPDDTLDKIDPKKLDQNVAVYAAMTWIAANSDAAFGPVPADPAQ